MSTQTKEFDRIWLQTCGDSMSEWYGEITWCQDKINDDDVEYVNARLHNKLLAQLAAERERADYAWRNTHAIERARQEEMANRDKLESALRGLLRFHQEGDDGAELPREYWSPGYREAVECAEALLGPTAGATS